MWNNRVKDEIGNHKVVQLKVSHIKAFYGKLAKAGYSHSTIKLLHTLILPTLELAVDDDIIRKNPARKALASEYGTEAKEKEILTLEQQKKLNFMLGRRCTNEIDCYSDFIFIAKTNRPYMPTAVNNVIYNIIDAYNKKELECAKKEHRKAELLPEISVHNLRHTACTNMARQGMNVKILQYIMGHSDSSITLDIYNHLDNQEDIKKEVVKCESRVVV